MILSAALLGLSVVGLPATAFVALSAIAMSPAHAATAEQQQIFAIENMTCALCPVTVKKAMEAVSGVHSVVIDFAAKTAKVTFDPAVTTIEAIAAASTNAGYPASAKS